MMVRSSSVTRFKEEIGNEKTSTAKQKLYLIFMVSVYQQKNAFARQ